MKIKQLTVLLFVSTFLCFSASAQLETSEPEAETTSDPYRILTHSVGFGIVGGGELRGGIWPMPGLGYKYHLPDGAFRVMVGGIVNSSVSSGGGFTNNYSESGFNVRVGYQYHVMLGRFMPIIGVDVAGGYYDMFTAWGTGSEDVENVSVGLSPNLGLEFWVSPKLSVLLDTRFDVSYQQYTSRFQSSDPWSPGNSETTVTGLNTHISPISSFMAIFHF